jgi:hypothetical protein
MFKKVLILVVLMSLASPAFCVLDEEKVIGQIVLYETRLRTVKDNIEVAKEALEKLLDTRQQLIGAVGGLQQVLKNCKEIPVEADIQGEE